MNQFFVAMKDGVRLSTFVHFPDDDGPWPVIFARSPYPNMLPVWKQKGLAWARNGYAFVLQECRGTGNSQGHWTPFINETADGCETLLWLCRQPWMDGNIGTYGASYSGVVQWAMVKDLPSEVKTMFISVTGIERYRQLYMNGMFRHDIYTVWAVGNSGVAPTDPSGGLYHRALLVRPHINMDVELFGKELPWYRDWITQVSRESEYWQSGLWAELSAMPDRLNIPIMLVGGWFDHNLDSSIASYLRIPETVRKESIFVIGPWIHTQSVSGDLEYPNHDTFGMQQDKAARDWFDHHLKGKPSKLTKGTVQTYAIGEGTWQTWNGWITNSSVQRYYFVVDSELPGALSRTVPVKNGQIEYLYDPETPVPSKGGSALMDHLSGRTDAVPPASVLQDPPGLRADIISFISQKVEDDTRIVGNITAHLYVSSDAADTAFTINVMEVQGDGRTYNIREGITSLEYRNDANSPQKYTPHTIVEVEIILWPITWTVRRGSRLRVDISSSNFPAYHVHPNVSGGWALQDEYRKAKQTVYVGEDYPTCIDIPVFE